MPTKVVMKRIPNQYLWRGDIYQAVLVEERNYSVDVFEIWPFASMKNPYYNKNHIIYCLETKGKEIYFADTSEEIFYNSSNELRHYLFITGKKFEENCSFEAIDKIISACRMKEKELVHEEE